jgi:hypothetical protein
MMDWLGEYGSRIERPSPASSPRKVTPTTWEAPPDARHGEGRGRQAGLISRDYALHASITMTPGSIRAVVSARALAHLFRRPHLMFWTCSLRLSRFSMTGTALDRTAAPRWGMATVALPPHADGPQAEAPDAGGMVSHERYVPHEPQGGQQERRRIAGD